ncbi:hypothetical protein V6N11_045724 [Hibiscus sabdariffa]|uniref:RNase H type-1 domain-containing protein n=1 Tax=Hibiscus sabdariffa TaxID=183260 RepID=A0ABR2Q1T0_9ROSI
MTHWSRDRRKTMGNEDVDHILRRCPKARRTWASIGLAKLFCSHLLAIMEEVIELAIQGELCGKVFFGLRHVWRLGFRKVEVETNNMEVARILNRSSNAFSENAMVLSIGAVFTLDWEIVARHIPRTANGVADRLAKLSRGLTDEEFQFTEPPAGATAATLEDLRTND